LNEKEKNGQHILCHQDNCAWTKWKLLHLSVSHEVLVHTKTTKVFLVFADKYKTSNQVLQRDTL